MLASTEALLDAGYGDRVFTQADLAWVFGGGSQRRYGLVNKALARGELVRLKRGVYCLGEKYRTAAVHELYAAGQVVPGSYVSFESALTYHGWIPERVFGVRSAVCRGRAARYVTEPFGELCYVRVAVQPFACLLGVGRREINGRPFLMADPLRAIGDHAYLDKIDCRPGECVAFLTEGLRVEPADLDELATEDFDLILSVYRSRRVVAFLEGLRRELDR